MKKFKTILCIFAISIAGLIVFGLTNQTQAAPRYLEQLKYDCPDQNEISESECEALVALYNDNNGRNWTNNSDWLRTDTPCNWYGITCENGHITKLKLVGSSAKKFGLRGRLVSEIGNLKNLIELDFSYNELSHLPAELWTLTNLEELVFCANHVESLSPEIGNLKNLTWLSFDRNRLSSIPSEIGNLTNLETVWLNDNQLTSLPSEIGSLSKLIRLQLYNNRLSSLPASFVNLTGLSTLSVRNNHLVNLSTALQEFLDEYDGPDWRNTQTPSPDADEYESDNDCANATNIELGPSPQHHTFHAAEDTDWATFTASSRGIYRVEVNVRAGSKADIDLAYFGECGIGSLKEWDRTFTAGVRLDIEADAGEQFFLELSHVDRNVFGPDVTYELSVYRLSSEQPTGAVIILAGRRSGADALQRNIDSTAEKFYRAMQGKGIARDDILFLSTDSDLIGHDELATADSLRTGITEWAAERVSDQRSLILYMVDHGARDSFYIDEVNGQYVSSSELDSWLRELEQAVDDVKITVIIEACHSGSFIDPANGTISRPGRLIITSTDVESDAYASPSGDGIVFSDAFITRLRKGDHMAEAFRRARDHAQSIFDYQASWLDGNGDGIPNEFGDGLVAAARNLDHPSVLSDKWEPWIAYTQPPNQVLDRHGTFQVEVRDDAGVGDVRAVIYPPNSSGRGDGDGVMDTSSGMDQVVLEYRPDLGENMYEGSYAGFTQEGTYRVLLYATDIDGLHAQSAVMPVQVRAIAYFM